MRWAIILTIICLLQAGAASGQSRTDSSLVPIPDSLLPKDTSYHRVKVSPPDTFLKEVERFSKRKNIFSKMLRSILVFHDQPVTPSIADPEHSEEDRFKNEENKVIRKIDIVVIDPFGPRISAPSRKPMNWLEKTGNSLHIGTRQWIIRNKLLFQQNDRVDGFKIAETERLLRSNSYITDARILVMSEEGQDSADVIVLVQDLWSISGGIQGDPTVPNGNFALNDQNFLGFGNAFTNKVWYDPNAYHPAWRYEGGYNVPNMGRSYISSNFFFSSVNMGQTYRISFNRPFYSSTVNWAGGYSQQWHNQEFKTVSDFGRNSINNAVDVNNDAWLGYAMNPSFGSRKLRRKTQVFISGRATLDNYVNRPNVPGMQWQDNTTYLVSTGVSFRDYYRDNFIFAYGKTEDVPVGYMFSYTTGLNFYQGEQRYYNSIKVSNAQHIDNFGYLFASGEMGGYLYESRWEQGLIALQTLYFTEMENIGPWKVRQYIGNKFIFGFNRRPGEVLVLDKNSGLRGYTLPFMGDKKMSANYEVDFFAPKNILGFRFVGVLFADAGLLGPSNQSLLSSKLYQGYGLGIRLKNEHLIFATAQFSFAFYVNTKPTDDLAYRYYYTEHPYYRFQDFQFGQPYTLGFNY